MKRTIIIALKVAIMGLLFYFLWKVAQSITTQTIHAMLTALRSRWYWLVLGQVFLLGMLLMTFYRWKLLLGAQGIHYTFGEAVSLGFIGFFFSQIIPGSTGGDVVKAYYVALEHPERRTAGITTVFLDRVVGLLDLMALAGVAILLNWRAITGDPWLKSLAGLVAFILAGAVVGGALFYSESLRSHPRTRALAGKLPFRDLLGKIQAAIYVYKFHPNLVMVAVVLSLLVQVSVICIAFCYSMALDLPINFLSLFFIVPLANLASSIPGSPGGVGQLEGAYSVLFHLFGFSEDSGLVLGIVQRLNWYVWSGVGWVYYMKKRTRINQARQMASRDEGALALESADS
jgi:glycosyltransferase 2 family protein